MAQRPRFTAEQCVNLLEVLEDVISATEEEEAELAAAGGGGGEGEVEGKAAGSAHLDVARQLRAAVRELVQTGAVAMSSPSAVRHHGGGARGGGGGGGHSRGDSDLVPLEDEQS